MRDLLEQIVRHEECPYALRSAMESLMTGGLDDAQTGALLMGLQCKTATSEELAACAKVIREKAVRVDLALEAVDIVGTGGDGSNTFNVSTACAFVVAGTGVPVAKHMNGSVSSRCGSADVLEELGVRSYNVKKDVEEHGLGFLYAPQFHPAMRHVSHVRKSLGIKTLFNLLGPLTHPAGVRRALIGVYEPGLTTTFAEVLRRLGYKRALVVHGDGLDELSITRASKVAELAEGRIFQYTVPPSNVSRRRRKPVPGGSPKCNARTILHVLQGWPGPAREMVELNSAAALYVAGRAGSLDVGVELARESINSGASLRKLRELQASKR